MEDASKREEAAWTPLDKDFVVDQPRIERAVREILMAIGENPDREGLLETPARRKECTPSSLKGSVRIRRSSPEILYGEIRPRWSSSGRRVSFDVRASSSSFTGKVHIGYIPKGRVVGLSKLARVVETVARRPQLQERMTEMIADLLMHELDAMGVGVVVEAAHACMTLRGVRKLSSYCVTSAMKGSFRTRPSTRAEFLNLALQK